MINDQFYELEQLINSAYGEEKVRLIDLDHQKALFTGCNGELTIQSIAEGFDIMLSQGSLMNELTEPMNELCGSAEYIQPESHSDQKVSLPYWSVSEFGRVQAAVLRYAQTAR